MSSARKKRENCQLVLTESINGASSDNSSQTTYLIEANELGKSDQDLKLELVRPHNSSQRNAQSYLSIIQIFKNVFLPEGFPSSVSEDYLQYQVWDTVQAFCSSVSGALAARAMFETMGVGDENSTVYGATLTWLIKDGTGMTGRILFAYYQGTSLDSNSKMWRLYADILNDFSFLVDLVTPFFARQHSIYFISFAGLLRSIVGISGGATRSALTQHQAIKNNLADVSAKDSSQETLVNLGALLFNLVLLSYLKDSNLLVWPLFFLFVIGHLFANYRAVKSVVMKTFNQNRLHIVTEHYLKNDGEVLRPAEANNKEPVLRTVNRFFRRIDLGTKLNTRRLALNQAQLNQLENVDSYYCLEFNIKKRKVRILLHEKCSHLNLVKCLFQIELVEFVAETNGNSIDKELVSLKSAIEAGDSNKITSESDAIVSKKFGKFISELTTEGWSFEYTQFSPNQYRYSVGTNKAD